MSSYFLKELKYRAKHLWLKWARPLAQGLVALLVALASVEFWNTESGQKLDLWALNNFFEMRGPLSPPNDVVIVAIDDQTYKELDISTRLPFPRRFMAEALENIVRADPKVLILDARIPK